ncbi:MAG: NifU family protein [Rickettsiales bacterium]|nr:NifU family protein [Rickettsiales bacterium]
MFIQTEQTPNPATLKFIADGHIITEAGNFEFKNQKQAVSKSPLALQLFEIKAIESIFIAKDFIVITKNDDTDWKAIKTEIIATIIDFIVGNKPIIFEGIDEDSKNSHSVNDNDSEIVKQIKELLDIKVRPAVAMDGGDIIFHSFEDGIVKLHLKGSCSGCPSSTITLKSGVEQMLKHYIPEIIAVEQIFDEE